MLTLLEIRDFVIVDRLSLEIREGFTALTGETGAGKSILIDAISLLTGGRLEGSPVREGASQARLSARFDAVPEAAQWLKNEGLESEDGDVLLTRVIDAGGRSRAFINGASCTLSQLRDLSQHLIDIHGQSEHQTLLRPSNQLALIDAYAGDEKELEKTSLAFKNWECAKAKLQEALSESENLRSEKERLEWIVDSLAPLSPKKGRWEAVSAEHKKLANSRSITDGIAEALQTLSPDEAGISGTLYHVSRSLEKLSVYDARFAPLAQELSEAQEMVSDAVRELEQFDTDFGDESRFEKLDAFLSDYFNAARSLHVAPEELWKKYEECKARLAELEDGLDTQKLTKEEAEARSAYFEASSELSALRRSSAGIFSKEVTRLMQELSLKGGAFEVRFEEKAPSAAGTEQAVFYVRMNLGAASAPLSKVASGGELSRISLAVSVCGGKVLNVPTVIFDEVDTGIGGATAEVVGSLIQKLSVTRQVLCITHLPQVASFAAHHLKVIKAAKDGRTVSRVCELTDGDRTDEIARMLAGLKIGDAARQNAKEMLLHAQKSRQDGQI